MQTQRLVVSKFDTLPYTDKREVRALRKKFNKLEAEYNKAHNKPVKRARIVKMAKAIDKRAKEIGGL